MHKSSVLLLLQLINVSAVVTARVVQLRECVCVCCCECCVNRRVCVCLEYNVCCLRIINYHK